MLKIRKSIWSFQHTNNALFLSAFLFSFFLTLTDPVSKHGIFPFFFYYSRATGSRTQNRRFVAACLIHLAIARKNILWNIGWGWPDSNRRVRESKSRALPLGDNPVKLRIKESNLYFPGQNRPYFRNTNPQKWPQGELNSPSPTSQASVLCC